MLIERTLPCRLTFLWQELGQDKQDISEGAVGWESLWHYVSSVKRQQQAVTSAADDGGAPMNTSEHIPISHRAVQINGTFIYHVWGFVTRSIQ